MCVGSLLHRCPAHNLWASRLSPFHWNGSRSPFLVISILFVSIIILLDPSKKLQPCKADPSLNSHCTCLPELLFSAHPGSSLHGSISLTSSFPIAHGFQGYLSGLDPLPALLFSFFTPSYLKLSFVVAPTPVASDFHPQPLFLPRIPPPLPPPPLGNTRPAVLVKLTKERNGFGGANRVKESSRKHTVCFQAHSWRRLRREKRS